MTFTYDCRNRLIEVTTDSGETTQYTYDAENVRTKVIKNADTAKETVTTYVTDNVSNELSRVLVATTVDKDGNTETIRYTYGNGLIALEKSAGNDVKGKNNTNTSSEYLIYHFNHLGSTTAVTDESGAIKYTYTYNIFGKLLSGNYGEVEFLYNGQYGVASDANGLYYMRARYYNIDIMRFINQDILTGSIDSSQSLNRYAYVEGNPVCYLDPFGLCMWDEDTVHDILSIISIVFQAAATIALVTGHPLIYKALSTIAMAASYADLVFKVADVIYATTPEQKEIATEKLAEAIVFSITSALIGVIGGNSTLGTDGKTVIPEAVMGKATAIVDYILTAIQSWAL